MYFSKSDNLMIILFLVIGIFSLRVRNIVFNSLLYDFIAEKNWKASRWNFRYLSGSLNLTALNFLSLNQS